MRRVLSRTAALLGAVFAALLIVSPLMIATAQAPQIAEDVLMQDEAWYFRARQPLAPVPEVNDPAGASGIPKAEVRNRSNPYQPETLHVGVVSGEPEAITFLAFPLFELSDTGLPPVVTGGKVMLVDAGSGLGSKNAAGAEMVACLATEIVVAAQGGDWEDLPPYDCASKATVQLVEGAEPLSWTIDLAPFTSTWADPNANFGIAILPDPDSASPPPEQSWHVAFQAKDWAPPEPSPRDQVSAPPAKTPITADLRYVAQSMPDFDDSGTDFDDQGDFGSGGPTFTTPDDFNVPTDSGPIESGELPPAVEVPEDTGGENVAAPEITEDERQGVRTNPAVYLLPFLGLGLAGMLGYSLSHDPELPTERDGAVSKLMARRRAGLGG